MRRNHTDKAKYYRYVIFVLSIVFLISAGFFFLKLWEQNLDPFAGFHPEDPYLEYQGKRYTLKEDIETFLILGLDKFEETAPSDAYNNDKQADFLMLFVFDNARQTYSAIHINRDTMANVNILGVAGNRIDTVTKQIALAHTYGNGKEVSCRNTVDAVSDLLMGIKIGHYISLTMDAVSVYNDLLGGVEVEILDDFTELDTAMIKGQRVTLDGRQALLYVRSRHGLGDGTNLNRMVRQRQYINALREKSLALFENDDAFLVETTLKMADYIVSDRSVTQLQELLRKFSDYQFEETYDIAGEAKVGEKYMEFYPDPTAVKELVISLFYQPEG